MIEKCIYIWLRIRNVNLFHKTSRIVGSTNYPKDRGTKETRNCRIQEKKIADVSNNITVFIRYIILSCYDYDSIEHALPSQALNWTIIENQTINLLFL